MIYHAHCVYNPRSKETQRRMNLARRTWEEQPWIDCPIPERSCRLFSDRGGVVPYIKDLFAEAINGKDNGDIIVFTNSDICVSPICCVSIVAALQSIDAGYCFRRDFGRLDQPLPVQKIKTGIHYCGSDLYAFRAGWWRQYRREYPDLLLGREAWDAVLRLLIDETHPGKNCTLYNLIYHEKHSSTWENPLNKRTLRSQLYNVELAKQWMMVSGYNPRQIGL